MYLASQVTGVFGAVYEITGPFRGTPPAPTLPPANTVRVLGTATLRRFRRSHLPVRVEAAAAGRVTAVLTARLGGRTVTLARAAQRVSAGEPETLRLRPSRRAARRLARRRRVTATLTVRSGDEQLRRRVRLL
jgi:hypothetical protein